jgi:hypothetical protein
LARSGNLGESRFLAPGRRRREESFKPMVGLLDEVLLLLSYEPETKRCPVIRIAVQRRTAVPREPT